MLLFVSLSSKAIAAESPLDPQESVRVLSSGRCPAPEAVRAGIFQLTSPQRRAKLPAVSSVTLNDDGDTYRVFVHTEGTTAERTFKDPTRDCERRARFAAVFAVLTLMPPELEEETPVPETLPERQPAVGPPVVADVRPSRPPSPALPPAVRTELALLMEQAAFEYWQPSIGGEVRLLPGRGNAVPEFSFSYTAPTRLQEGDFAYSLWRLTAGAALRVRAPLGPAEVSASGGPSLLYLHSEGEDIARSANDTAFTIGLRVGAFASLPLRSRVSLIVAAHGMLLPSSPTLRAEPRGDIGRSPAFWAGASMGVALGLF